MADELRKVMCAKLGREGEGLARPPYKNELGQRIYENVSKEAWKMWLEHAKMLINEFHIDLGSKQGTEFLLGECEKYFFGEGSQLPPDFRPEGQQSK